MNYSWTKEEIDTVIQYENLLNQYFFSPSEINDESLLKEILFLEGKLLMINKYVVLCIEGSVENVLPFREFLDLEQKSTDGQKIVTFFPVNFTNESEYVNHLFSNYK